MGERGTVVPIGDGWLNVRVDSECVVAELRLPGRPLERAVVPLPVTTSPLPGERAAGEWLVSYLRRCPGEEALIADCRVDAERVGIGFRRLRRAMAREDVPVERVRGRIAWRLSPGGCRTSDG